VLEAVIRASAIPATALHARTQHSHMGAAFSTAAQGTLHIADEAAEARGPAQNTSCRYSLSIGKTNPSIPEGHAVQVSTFCYRREETVHPPRDCSMVSFKKYRHLPGPPKAVLQAEAASQAEYSLQAR